MSLLRPPKPQPLEKLPGQPVLTLTRNCLDLTQRLVTSLIDQELRCSLLIIDNDSTDGTPAWLEQQAYAAFVSCRPQRGVSAGWNLGLQSFFDDPRCRHVLVVNNDVELPPWFYSTMLEVARRHRIPFLTGVAVDDRSLLRCDPDYTPVPHPDFSAFLILREAWERIGPFDESMVLYASDCDYHIRGWRLGIPMMKAHVPFYHERSSTLRSASPADRAAIESQADADRAALERKWSCRPGTEAYASRFTEFFWGIEVEAADAP